jgi:hypothetical protein
MDFGEWRLDELRRNSVKAKFAEYLFHDVGA